MNTLVVKNYLKHLENIEKGCCWYLVKQDTTFWKQCYYVSILEKYKEYKKSDLSLNFENFFNAEIEELNKSKNFNLPLNHRALRISYFYGLLNDPEQGYRNYAKTNATKVYFDILERTNGDFEKDSLYKDIIQNQIEKMFISSIIDEQNESIRSDFRLYPVLFLYKILLELGYSTGKFELSLDEYKYFVITQPTYENFLNCLLLIIESREDTTILEKAGEFKDKLDSRFHLTLEELDSLEITNESIILKNDAILRVAKLVSAYENKELSLDEDNYIDFLTSDRKLDSNLVEKFQNTGQIDNQAYISLSKPFLLLAGISGTGKSRFVREQVEKKERKERYQLVTVRPDWHEPSDLLGYVSRLSVSAQYVMTDVLKFIVKAWQAVEKYCKFEKNEDDRIVVKGDLNLDLRADIAPYWLCLDEMNLAPVEQYFADYLSVLETRAWQWNSEGFEYYTEALLSPTTWSDISDFQQTLGVSDKLWEFFQQNGIGIPFNLIVAGTVNMDETTYAFSRKVLDRALSFDFSEFYPNEFDTFFTPTTKPKLLTYPIYSQLKQEDLDDELVNKSIKFITALNQKFENTPFKLGYRALNELLLSVQAFQAKNDIELQAVWDDFVMTKVLPRIEGDETKVGDVLDKIETVLKEQLGSIWQSRRPDLWRESTKEPKTPLEIKCRSLAKVEHMKKLLKDRGMVSFW